jgi:putative peptidoglycan lipid II flippase
MGPAILGNAAVQINVMVNTNFASSLTDPLRGPDGPVSWLGYAFRFMQLPLGLFGVAIASATLPAVSRSAARGDMPEFRQTLARSIAFVFLLTIPSSVGLALLGPAMIGAIYEVGEFNAYDTRQTGVALSCFAIGLAGYAALKVLTPAFYALQDSRTPMLISVASIAINYVAAAGILRGLKLGHAGLALSTSIVAMFGFGVSFLILRNRIAGLEGRALARSTIRIVAASVVMGVVVQGSTSLIQQLLGVSKAARIADLLVSVPLGALVFWLAARWLGVPELGIATRAFAGPMERASRMLHSLTGNRLNQSRGHD